MSNFLIPEDPAQALRMKRHLVALFTILIYTMFIIYIYTADHFLVSKRASITALVIFWAGNFSFTAAIRFGYNLRFADPSLTLLQIIWNVCFMIFLLYALNDLREVIFMSYFALLSFGNFRLKGDGFIIISSIAISGYIAVLAILYVNQPERLHIINDLIVFFGFAFTCMVLIYTGSSISRLRENKREQNRELIKALELNTRLATMDDLTGLYTRRYLMGILEKQKALSERDDSDFVVCFADLDHFKYVNDSFGHHTGDKVLQIFSGIIRASIREIDYASRFGGEEFVILLVNTDIDKAVSVAERIRAGIEKYNFSDIAPALNVTVSIGMSNYKSFSSIQETLMSADNKMYSAKDAGRNKVVYKQ